MRVVVNGAAREVDPQCTVADLMADLLGPRTDGTAVALDDQVVPRSAWAGTRLAPGARVEVLRAVAGG